MESTIARKGLEDKMKHRNHTLEQLVRKLGEADRMLGEGASVVAVCKHLEIAEQTYYRWRNQYGGMKTDDAEPPALLGHYELGVEVAPVFRLATAFDELQLAI